jgi:probable F420-dependent oxidoreductase
MNEMQFGVNVHAVGSGEDLAQLVRRADELGYDVFAAPDHLGFLAPFAALTAAACVSPRLRLRTYVLDTGFWNAALLAREVATLDLISGGRAELGLGAGHMRSEHEDAGLPWLPLAERVEALERTLTEVRGRLADPDHRPAPVQRPVPVLVGAMSAAGLAVAARHADVVGFAGLRQVRGAPPGSFTMSTAAQTRDRVAEVRRQAGGRAYRSDVLLQAVVVDEDPTDAAARIAASAPGLTPEQLLDSPFVLLARDPEEAADELRHRRQAYGFDSITTHQPHLEAHGRVISAYRAVGVDRAVGNATEV